MRGKEEVRVVSRESNKCYICLRETDEEELIKNNGLCEYCAYMRDKNGNYIDRSYVPLNNIDEVLEKKRKGRRR